MAFEFPHLLESPINTSERASKTWLPYGKQPAPKAALTEAEKLARLAESRTGRVNAKATLARKTGQLLDYYAGTDVPFDRIAEHLNLKPEQVAEEMAQRGRKP